jgi:hypothetical protein
VWGGEKLPGEGGLRRRRLKVISIDDTWEIAEEWWRTRPISRTYYRVTLDDGKVITLFRDMMDGAWHQQRE